MVAQTFSSPEQEKPISWRLRSDLEFVRETDLKSGAWIIKDPLRLTYLRTSDPELMFLSACDGRKTLPILHAELQAKFPGQDITQSALRSILLSAIQSGIMASTVPGHGTRLSEQKRVRAGRAWLRAFNLISYRWRGIDPTILLDRLLPAFRWVYRPGVILLLGGFVLTIGFLILTRLDLVWQELPQISSLLTLQNAVMLTIAVAVVKAIHELGHALTCRYFKGECHELGCLLVLFVPLLYCDVSDSWTMTSRWQRISIAAAGILVELFVAATCGLLWMWTYPGILHSFFLNVMILCSANTLLVNGNPLLRYDGYYVLSDLLRIPNLASESQLAALGFSNRIVFGTPGIVTGYSPAGRLGLAMWGVLSGIYRLGISFTFLILFYQLLKTVGLQILVVIPTLSLITGLIMSNARFLKQGIHSAPRRQRALAGSGILILVMILILTVPISLPLKTSCILTPGDSVPVYVRVAGAVESKVEPGQQVEAGQVLAVLRNAELRQDIVALRGDIRETEARIATLENYRTRDASLADALAVNLKSLESLRARLAALEEMERELVIRSPRAGKIFLPRNSLPQFDSPQQAEVWSGWALTRANQNAWLEPQTVLCWVGSEDDWRVSALVEQSQVDLLEEKTTATVRFLLQPDNGTPAELEQLGTVPVDEIDRELMSHRLVAMSSTDPGKSQQSFIMASLRLKDSSEIGRLPLYASGTARIQSKRMSIASRLWRLAIETFKFRM